jgi:hypothetical protein
MRSMRLRSRYMRLSQRILALRLDLDGCGPDAGLMQAGADGVGIVALVGETGGPVLGTPVPLACEMTAHLRTRSRIALLCLASILGGCSASGAPSFDLFGAFFPAWLLCGVIGIAGAGLARVAFVSRGLANVLPYQLAVCTAIGVITAVMVWLVGFGR